MNHRGPNRRQRLCLLNKSTVMAATFQKVSARLPFLVGHRFGSNHLNLSSVIQAAGELSVGRTRAKADA
jgi:hypothetical protein